MNAPVPTAWALVVGLAWAAAIGGLALGQPAGRSEGAVPAWAVAVGTAAFAALVATFVGLVLRRRWALACSTVTALGLTALAAGGAGDGRPGWKPTAQVVPLVLVGVLSVVAWRASAAADRAGHRP